MAGKMYLIPAWIRNNPKKIALGVLTLSAGGLRALLSQTAQSNTGLIQYNQSPVPTAKPFVNPPWVDATTQQSARWAHALQDFEAFGNVPDLASNLHKLKIIFIGEQHQALNILLAADAIIKGLAQDGDVLLMEGGSYFGSEQINLRCENLYFTLNGEVRESKNIAHRTDPKFIRRFPQGEKWICRGWEQKSMVRKPDDLIFLAPVIQEQEQKLHKCAAAFEDVRSKYNQLVQTCDNALSALNEIQVMYYSYQLMVIRAYEIYIPNESQNVKNSLPALGDKLFAKYQSFLKSPSEKRHKSIISALKELKKLITALEDTCMLLATKLETLKKAQARATHQEFQDGQPIRIVERNELGMIASIRAAFEQYNPKRLFVIAGAKHVLTRRSLIGNTSIEDIEPTDPQYSIRHYLASNPYGLFVHKKVFEGARAAEEDMNHYLNAP